MVDHPGRWKRRSSRYSARCPPFYRPSLSTLRATSFEIILLCFLHVIQEEVAQESKRHRSADDDVPFRLISSRGRNTHSSYSLDWVLLWCNLLNSRDLRRAAFFLWITPFWAALSSALTAI